MRRRIEGVLRLRALALLAMAPMVVGAGRASAQGAVATPDTVELSLEEAERRATEDSEEIRLARASVELARAQVTEVRAQALPQLNANLGYTRTLASVFQQAEIG